MSKIVVTHIGASHPAAFLPLEFGPRLKSAGHFKGDIDIQYVDDIAGRAAECLLVTNVFNDQHWMQPEYNLIQCKVLAGFDFEQPEPVPGGSMKNAWQKGKEACLANTPFDQYPGDHGTAPHTVWLKGYLWAWIQHNLS